MELNGRLHVVAKEGKPELEGVLRLFYEGLRNITISHVAVKRFFDEYGHEKASLKLLKWHKGWLEEEMRKYKLLIEGGYDLQIYKEDLKELEADYKLVLELIKRLESEVKELSKEEFRDERGDVE